MHSTALRYFLEVVRSGSLNQAAESLHIAASAISRQIANLEDEVDAQLFERRPTGMVLSPAGEILAVYARRADLEQKRVLAEVQQRAAEGGGLITIASTGGIARKFLPHVMHAFTTTHRKTRFVLTVVSPKNVIEKVANGEVDLGITFSVKPSKGVRIEYAERSPICALMLRGHPLSDRKLLSLADLQPYAMALTEEGTTQRQLFDQCCQMESISVTPVLVSNDSEVLRGFMELSNTIILTSKVSVQFELSSGDLVCIPLSNPELHMRDVQVLTMLDRTLPVDVQEFVRLVVKEIV